MRCTYPRLVVRCGRHRWCSNSSAASATGSVARLLSLPVQRKVPTQKAVEGAHVQDKARNVYEISDVDWEGKVTAKLVKGAEDAPPSISFTPEGSDDDYDLVEVSAPAPAQIEAPAQQPVPKPVEMAGAPSSDSKAKIDEKKVSAAKRSKEYPELGEFTYALPGGVGTLEWRDEAEFYTENGWMSQNLYVGADASKALGAPEGKGLSIHAIVAVKYPATAKVIRLNPHVTLRDAGRQRARDARERERRAGAKGFQMPKKSPEDREADLEDAAFSVQVGMKSTRMDKGGQANKLGLSGDPEKLGFTEEWLKGMVKAAADARVDQSWTVELGTMGKEF